MGLFARALAAAAGAALLLPASGSARDWGPIVPLPDSVSWDAAIGLAPVGTAWLYTLGGNRIAGTVGSVDAGGALGGPAQALGVSGGPPVVRTDAAGEVFAVAFDSYTGAVELSSRAAGATAFSGPLTIGSGVGTYGFPPVVLAVSPGGWAALAFAVSESDGTRPYVAIRAPGGSFGAPVPATGSVASTDELPMSIAVNDAGEAVVGLREGNAAYAAIRSGGVDGTWRAAQPLDPAEPNTPRDASAAVLVGIDPAGGAVAVWQHANGVTAVDRLAAAFRAPAGSFGPPADLGIDTAEAPALAVSAFGEVIVAAAQATPLDGGGLSLGSIAVVSGSTVLGYFAAAGATASGQSCGSPLLAMNPRGDAVLATISCSDYHGHLFRRAPFGEFDDGVALPRPAGAPAFFPEQPSDLKLDGRGNAAAIWIDASSPMMQLDFAADGPALTSAAPVLPPSPLVVAQLVPPVIAPQPVAQAGGPLPWLDPVILAAIAAANAAALPQTPVAPIQTAGSSPAPRVRGRLTLTVSRLPAATGTPRIVVAVQCPAACRTSVGGTLVTPAHARIRLQRIALTAEAGQTAIAGLRLSAAATRALRSSRARPRVGGTRSAGRRFRLSVTAVAGDADGQPQTSSVVVSFLRR